MQISNATSATNLILDPHANRPSKPAAPIAPPGGNVENRMPPAEPPPPPTRSQPEDASTVATTLDLLG